MSVGDCYADLRIRMFIYPRRGSICSDGRRFEIVDATGMSSILLKDHNTFGARVVSAAPGLIEIHRLSEIPRSTGGRPSELEVPAPSASHSELLNIMKPQVLRCLAEEQEDLVQKLIELKSILAGLERMREAIFAEPRGGVLRSMIAEKENDRIRAESHESEGDGDGEKKRATG